MDKQRKVAAVKDLATTSEEGAIARAERGAREGMETESNSGPHGNWNHGGGDPKTGGSSKSS